MVWTPTELDQTLIGRDRDRLDVVIMSRPGLRDCARRLHELANALERLSKHGPEDVKLLSDRSALMLARSEVQACQANLKAIWKREKELRNEFKREAVKKVVSLGR